MLDLTQDPHWFLTDLQIIQSHCITIPCNFHSDLPVHLQQKSHPLWLKRFPSRWPLSLAEGAAARESHFFKLIIEPGEQPLGMLDGFLVRLRHLETGIRWPMRCKTSSEVWTVCSLLRSDQQRSAGVCSGRVSFVGWLRVNIRLLYNCWLALL